MEASHQEPKPLTLCEVFSETKRIHKSNRRTFNALAFLFLFPSSLAAVLSQILAKSLSHAAASKSLFSIPPNITIILLAAAAYFLALVCSPCALGSITYAAFQGFHGEPVKLKAAIKSIAASFFPLLATILAVQLVVFAATFAFALLVIVIISTTAKATPLGLTASQYLLRFATAMFVVLMVYLQVNWTLAYAVVVAESSRGFAALERSKALIKGKRGLALSMSLFYGGFSFLLVLWSYSVAVDYAANLGGASRPPAAAEWRGSFYNSATVLLFCSAMLTLVQLSNLIANAVLYVHCRADVNNNLHARGDYFSLPYDDENVALVV